MNEADSPGVFRGFFFANSVVVESGKAMKKTSRWVSCPSLTMSAESNIDIISKSDKNSYLPSASSLHILTPCSAPCLSVKLFVMSHTLKLTPKETNFACCMRTEIVDCIINFFNGQLDIKIRQMLATFNTNSHITDWARLEQARSVTVDGSIVLLSSTIKFHSNRLFSCQI